MKEANCPVCKTSHEINKYYVFLKRWFNDGSVPIICKKCTVLFITNIATKKEKFEIGDIVAINNYGHGMHNKTGRIIEAEHIHYKVEFKSGFRLWVPDHWIIKAEGHDEL